MYYIIIIAYNLSFLIYSLLFGYVNHKYTTKSVPYSSFVNFFCILTAMQKFVRILQINACTYII